MTEIKTQPGSGRVMIADEVIAIIAGTAALEVEGVAGMVGNLSGGLAEILGHKNLAKGVNVEVTGDEAVIDANISVKFGYKIHDISTDVQKRIKNAVETMTGLTVNEIRLNVAGVLHAKELQN